PTEVLVTTKHIGLFVLCVELFVCSASGQEFRASLAGRITDMTGGAVCGAMVSAINQDTNALVSAHSNELGNSVFHSCYPATTGSWSNSQGSRKLSGPVSSFPWRRTCLWISRSRLGKPRKPSRSRNRRPLSLF